MVARLHRALPSRQLAAPLDEWRRALGLWHRRGKDDGTLAIPGGLSLVGCAGELHQRARVVLRLCAVRCGDRRERRDFWRHRRVRGGGVAAAIADVSSFTKAIA